MRVQLTDIGRQEAKQTIKKLRKMGLYDSFRKAVNKHLCKLSTEHLTKEG